jgi:hypothetical protein
LKSQYGASFEVDFDDGIFSAESFRFLEDVLDAGLLDGTESVDEWGEAVNPPT